MTSSNQPIDAYHAETAPPAPPLRRLLEALAVVVAAVVLMLGAVGGDFVSDDEVLIRDNEGIRELGNIPKFFGATFFPTLKGLTYYRPLTATSYAVDYAISGRDTAGYHVTNLFLHALASLLVFSLLARLGVPNPFPLLGGLAFATTAVHVEAVAWISGRPGVLCAVFILACLHVHLSYRKSGAWWLAAVIFIFSLAALLSKETALVLPLALVTFDLVLPGDSGRGRRLLRSIPVYAATVAGIVVFMVMRHLAVAAFFPGQRYLPLGGLGLGGRILFMGKVVTQWLRLLVAPLHLATDYSHLANPVFSKGYIEEITGFFILAALVTVGILAGRRQPLVGWMLLAAGIFLIPVSQVVPIGIVLSERSLYLPSAFFTGAVFVSASGIFTSFFRSEKLHHHATGAGALAASVLFIVAGAWNTWPAAKSFENDIALWARASAAAPRNGRARDNLAAALLKRKDVGYILQAHDCAKTATRLEPFYAPAYTTTGMAAAVLGDLAKEEELKKQFYAEAEAAFRTAADRLPDQDPKAFIEFGRFLMARGRHDEAIPYLRRAIGTAMNQRAAYGRLALALSETGKFDEALEVIENGRRRFPADSSFIWIRGRVNLDMGRGEKAVGDFHAALEFPGMADNVAYRVWLGDAYLRLKENEKAVEVFDGIIRTSRDERETYTVRRLRALANIRLGRTERARYDLNVLEKALPGHALVKELREKFDASLKDSEEEEAGSER